MIVIKVLSLILWLFAVPFCIGLIPMPWIPEEKRGIGVALVAGYFIMLPLCWLVTVPCILLVKYDSFLVMVRWFTGALALAVAAGIGIGIWSYKKGNPAISIPVLQRRKMGWEEAVGWLVFFGLIFWQLYKAFTLTSFDGDDAEYVAQSLVTWQSNTMYLIKPYTGGTTSLDIRHSLAVLPVWVAYIGRMSGVHPTILNHSVLSFVWIPLAYIVFYQIGRHLLKDKREHLPFFMIIMALLQIFGNVSIYTNETFFLTRTWQGKAVAASFVIPATIWLLLWIFDGKDGGNGRESAGNVKFWSMKDAAGRKYDRETAGIQRGQTAGLWALLALVNMTAGVCTSMVVFLNVVLIGASAFWLTVAERKFSILVKAGLVCIPNGIYMLLYLFLHA